MEMVMRIHQTLLMLTTILLVGCGREIPVKPDPLIPLGSTPSKPVIIATFYPLVYLAGRIAGDLAEVHCPLPADADAATWMPGDQAIAAMQAADLVLINGASFESWTAQLNLPPTRTVDTTAILKPTLLTYDHALEHSHGPAGEHAHEGIDGHTWLDPINLKMQASAIHQAVLKRFPGQREAIDDRFKELMDDLDALHRSLLSVSGDLPIIAAHPAYNYLAKRYNWNLRNLDLDPQAAPDQITLQDLKRMLSNHPSIGILWESEPLPEIQALLKRQFGLGCYVFSPCEHAPESDYLAVMQANVEGIRNLLK